MQLVVMHVAESYEVVQRVRTFVPVVLPVMQFQHISRIVRFGPDRRLVRSNPASPAARRDGADSKPRSLNNVYAERSHYPEMPDWQFRG